MEKEKKSDSSENSIQKKDQTRRDAVHSAFLGPKGENKELLADLVKTVIEKTSEWRNTFYGKDKDIPETKIEDNTIIKDVVKDVLELLDSSSAPWAGPRYLAQMNSDTMLVSNIAYFAAMLRNLNNVAYESSIPTIEMEKKVVSSLIKLFGYDESRSIGYIALDGTLANYEALELARDLKLFPLAFSSTYKDLRKASKEDTKELVNTFNSIITKLSMKDLIEDDRKLLNMPIDKIIDLVAESKREGHEDLFDAVIKNSIRSKGFKYSGYPGKILVPRTRHYSIEKAASILGFGTDSIELVDVDENYRMDMADLRRKITRITEDEKSHIAAVVGIVGTTEEGAVDDIEELMKIREECGQKGVNFYVHIDAAYGGYFATMYKNDKNEFVDGEDLSPSEKRLLNIFKNAKKADSITIDPHKLGYVPYPAGGILIKDGMALNLLNVKAPYIFREDSEDIINKPSNINFNNISKSIVEGSRPGASAAAVYAAIKYMPLNNSGYGAILKNTLQTTKNFITFLKNFDPIRIHMNNGEEIKVFCKTLVEDPDLNIMSYAFNFEGNESLEVMNNFNSHIHKHFGYEANGTGKDTYSGREIVLAINNFDRDQYDKTPINLLSSLKIPGEEWEKIKNVNVFRSVAMHPYVITAEDFNAIYYEPIKKAIEDALSNFNNRAQYMKSKLRK